MGMTILFSVWKLLRTSGLVFGGRGLLANLGQGSAIPDGDGDAAQRGRGGKQEAGAPEIPGLRRRLGRVYQHRTGSEICEFSYGHRFPGGLRNLIFRSASMVSRGEVEPRKIQESGFKKFENAFFYEIRYFQLEVRRMYLLI
jgi:hypothetical protein